MYLVVMPSVLIQFLTAMSVKGDDANIKKNKEHENRHSNKNISDKCNLHRTEKKYFDGGVTVLQLVFKCQTAT